MPKPRCVRVHSALAGATVPTSGERLGESDGFLDVVGGRASRSGGANGARSPRQATIAGPSGMPSQQHVRAFHVGADTWSALVPLGELTPRLPRRGSRRLVDEHVGRLRAKPNVTAGTADSAQVPSLMQELQSRPRASRDGHGHLDCHFPPGTSLAYLLRGEVSDSDMERFHSGPLTALANVHQRRAVDGRESCLGG